jgi:hypothetical protein
MCEFYFNVCCRSKGVARFIGVAFGTVRVVRERRGVCGIVCYPSMKNLLFFFFYFMGWFEGSGKGRQTDLALALCRRC